MAETLDKMMSGRKTRKTGGNTRRAAEDNSNQKHLTGLEVKQLIEATAGRGTKHAIATSCS
jgi:hypothetical protein